MKLESVAEEYGMGISYLDNVGGKIYHLKYALQSADVEKLLVPVQEVFAKPLEVLKYVIMDKPEGWQQQNEEMAQLYYESYQKQKEKENRENGTE